MGDGSKNLRSVPFRENYSSSGSSLLNEFYIPALSNAVTYERATGYFSSAILALAPVAFSEFATRSGKMRLLCSPHLSEADAKAILNLAESDRPAPLEVAATSLAELAHGTHLETRAVACLRALIDAGILEVRFVTAGRSGLFHDKLGIFTDEFGNKVSFIGSANETAAAWSGFANHEQIEVFRNWTDDTEERRCARHEDQFDETWEGLRRGLIVTSSTDAADVIRSVVPSESLEDIVASLRQAVGRAELQPDVIQLRDYQIEVLDSWHRADDRGVVAFATGGGKTRTALEAVRQWTASGRPALIMVPSELLHQQWANEIATHLSKAAVLQAGAGYSREGWSRRLSDYTRDDTSLGQRIVLATYQTAATSRFLELIRDGAHLLVVSDEVHRVGAQDTRRVLEEIAAGARLGLSATPQRFGDPIGTAAINEYFGKILEPTFTLRNALDASVLVPYDYDFVVCPLTEDEEERWDALTARVAHELARNKGDMTDFALHLLRQRARIAKRAAGKAPLARSVVSQRYRPGDRWLIYCNDIDHLREVRRELEALDIDLLAYHSQDEGDHDATLSFFTNRGGVLLAIKCLDEGIDIPLINRALILASSTNPREYIQRRGRVLRRTPGKYSAAIFDVIVVGSDGKAITPSEVVRAMGFAEDSRNVAPSLYLEDLLPTEADGATAPSDIEEE
jgi:superfamily II DNA or RNA helicase